MQPSLCCSSSWTWLFFGPFLLDLHVWLVAQRLCCCGVVEEGCARNPYLRHTAPQRVAVSYPPGDNSLLFSPGLFLAQKNISPCWLATTWSSVHRHCPSVTHKHTHTLTLPTNKLPVTLTHTDSYTSLTSHALTHRESYASLTLPHTPSCRHKISQLLSHTHAVTRGKHPSDAQPPLAHTHTHTNSHLGPCYSCS